MASRKNLIKSECIFKDSEMTTGLPSTSVSSVSSCSLSSASNMQLALLHIRGAIYISVSLKFCSTQPARLMWWPCLCISLFCLIRTLGSQASSDNLQMSDSRNNPKCVSKDSLATSRKMLSRRHVMIVM